MNQNQLNFLDELADLLDKYNIDCVYISEGKITFSSNGNGLGFNSFDSDSGTYQSIETYQKDYHVK